MRRRSRKQRRIVHRRLGDECGSHGKNCCGNSFCSEGEIQNCKIKLKESATHGHEMGTKDLQIIFQGRTDNKQLHRLPQKKCKSPNVGWYENNGNLTFPSSTITSIAFFIPLNNCVSQMAFENTLKWNSLLYYESNTSALLLQYQPEQDKRNLYRSCTFRQRSMKCRSSSESSANSEDSIVFFENDDSFGEDTRTCNKVDSTADAPIRSSLNPSSFSERTNSISKSHTKKVRFLDNAELVTVHLIIAWDYAYRAARISPWEAVARDTNRFKLKIQSIEPILNPVLEQSHRRRIWETRIREFEYKRVNK